MSCVGVILDHWRGRLSRPLTDDPLRDRLDPFERLLLCERDSFEMCDLLRAAHKADEEQRAFPMYKIAPDAGVDWEKIVNDKAADLWNKGKR